MPENIILEEVPLEQDSSGEPIYGFRLEKKHLNAFVKMVRDKTNGQCLFATKEEGEHVNVIVMPMSDKASGEFKQAMEEIRDAASLQARATSALDASSVSFQFPKQP